MTSFYIQTYGCSANVSDSEQMAGLLKQAQFDPSEKLEDADIVVYNTCTVKGPTADKFFHTLQEAKKQFPYKIIVVAGCIAQSDRERLEEFSLIGPNQIHNIAQVVEEALNNNVVKALEMGEMPPLNLPKIRKNPVVEIIPINRGCLSACTFCKTKEARGNLKSYPVKEIVHVALGAVNEGVKEIWLTSQDTMCYGFDIETNVAELLKELVKIPGKFKIRLGMGNPVHLKRIKEELIPLLRHSKMFRFIHLPNQSGSNKVLKDMRRGNTNEEYLQLVKELRRAVPNITIATDVIVGYPTESEEDFWETLTTLRSTNPEIVNISRFWPRPGTPAAKLKEIPVDVVKKRTGIVTDIFRNISRLQNERWRGWEGSIVIDEKGKDGQWIGRNASYKPVIVEGDFKLGDVVPVKIVKTTTFDLRGEVMAKVEVQ